MLQVNQLLDQLQQRRRGLLSFGAIVALWAASSGVRAVMNALNVVYGVKEERPAWERYALSILYTLGLGALLILAAALLLVTPQAMRWLADQAGLPHFFTALWAWWLRWPVVLLLLMFVLAFAISAYALARSGFQAPAQWSGKTFSDLAQASRCFSSFRLDCS